MPLRIGRRGALHSLARSFNTQVERGLIFLGVLIVAIWFRGLAMGDISQGDEVSLVWKPFLEADPTSLSDMDF